MIYRCTCARNEYECRCAFFSAGESATSVTHFVCDFHKERKPLPHETCVCGIVVSASGIETEGHDRGDGHGAKHESPTVEDGDAQEQSHD